VEDDLATARRNWEVHNPTEVAASLCGELRQAHERLFAEMANMDVLTQAPGPDWVQFCAARWRISEASLARRTLAARIIDYLLARVGAEDVVELKRHKAADQQLLRASAAHVSAWPLKGIQSDWRGYCKASRQVRAQMSAFLRSEQRILFPMLGDSGPAGSQPRAAFDERSRLGR
jgi:hypothetical protein